MNGNGRLILVPGHALFKAEVASAPANPAANEPWSLLPFQNDEPPVYLEHIRAGVELASKESDTVLVFSGGTTRPDAGYWTEASSYYAAAAAMNWWDFPKPYVMKEEFAADSFENFLFSLCRFRVEAGAFPATVIVIGWPFKKERFEMHRDALRYPVEAFTYMGIGEPRYRAAAEESESKTRELFRISPYGLHPEIREKRMLRNPLRREHPYVQVTELNEFFEFLHRARHDEIYAGAFPWHI